MKIYKTIKKGMDIQHNYDNKRKGRQIKIINHQKISSLSLYHSSGDNNYSNHDNNIKDNRENILYSFETNAGPKEDKDNHLDTNNSISSIVDPYTIYQKKR